MVLSARPRVVPSHRLFQKTVDVVSKNGNMLLNLGLRADGSIPEAEVTFLEDMAAWTRVVGEGLYRSRPWLVYGEIEPGQEFFFREHSRKGIVYDDPTDAEQTKNLQKLAAEIRLELGDWNIAGTDRPAYSYPGNLSNPNWKTKRRRAPARQKQSATR